MLFTARSARAMVSAPHHLAAQAGLGVLRDGGNAIEAMIAAAATIAVVYPHMNAIGGDGFWLIAEPGREPVGIDACGGAASLATRDFYADAGHIDAIPPRGGLAALTAAGTLAGWSAALQIALSWGGRMPLVRLLDDAITNARAGVPVTEGYCDTVAAKQDQLCGLPGFEAAYMMNGAPPRPGWLHVQPALADTLAQIAENGPEDFYRGDLARVIAAELEAAGSPLRLGDLEAVQAAQVRPLSVPLDAGTVFNMPPPTQGLASLIILALYDRMRASSADGFDHVHRLIEATKRAFRVRDRHVTDPRYASAPAQDHLHAHRLDEQARAIDMNRAAPWPAPSDAGDTVWMGAIDAQGRAVSFIQSIYWEFGSGIVLPKTGVLWQNRGSSLSLQPEAVNALEPGRKPFHTLNPALARLNDGRLMVYGTMGGEGQPQTQAALFTRHIMHHLPLQEAITAPRWLLGRTWGAATTTLKLESRFDPALIKALIDAGHDVEVLGEFEQSMGHAGAIVRHGDGLLEGASDPRSDGSVAAI